MNKLDITAAFLREILDYDKDTGILTWKERKIGSPHWKDKDIKAFNTKWAGKEAGRLVKYNRAVSCRREVTIFGYKFRSYRLIWRMVTGEWPKDQIDHIDQDSTNDRWDNLRESTHTQNARNTPMSKANNSGYVGVGTRSNGKFRCRIQVNGVEYSKTFETEEEAIEGRERLKKEHGFTENHGRPRIE